jgi:hypothetical protein
MWISEYEELMFCKENDDNKTLKAIQLKYDNMPDMFYKYRNANENSIEALDNDILYFSAVSQFNDPYECAMLLSYMNIKEMPYKIILDKLRPFLRPGFSLASEDFISQEVLTRKIVDGLMIPQEDRAEFEGMWKLTDEIIKIKLDETGKEVSGIGDEIYRVCSFSELNDTLLMWAHYANDHRGFCIGYSFKELNNDLTELLLPVIYSDNLLEISQFMFPTTNKSLIMNAITRKSSAWEYEKEWRIVMLKNNEEKVQSQRMPVPKKVYLGTRISEKDKNAIIEIAKRKNIQVYQMYMKSDDFKLYSRQIM